MMTELEVRAAVVREQAKKRRKQRAEKAKVLWAGKPITVSFKRADNLAWIECSLYIRERDWKRYGVCYWCEAAPIEHATHVISRQKRAIKYDERNIYGGCHTCNWKDRYVPGHHDIIVNIFIRKNGPALYRELVELSQKTVDDSAHNLMDWAEHFKAKRTIL